MSIFKNSNIIACWLNPFVKIKGFEFFAKNNDEKKLNF